MILPQNSCSICQHPTLLQTCARCMSPGEMMTAEAVAVQQAIALPEPLGIEDGIRLLPIPEDIEEDYNEILKEMLDLRREGYIKIDMERADEYLASETAQETFLGEGHRLTERFVGKSYYEILMQFMMKYVEPDNLNKRIGWCKPTYKFCEIGQALIDSKIIRGARQYAKGDPFTLPTVLNDILTGRFYRNWDDSAAYQRFMRSLTQIKDAQVILDKFLSNKADLIDSIAKNYYGENYNKDQKYSIKVLLHMLSMDGLLKNWRLKYNIKPKIADHDFVIEYARVMNKVTGEFCGWNKSHSALNVIQQIDPDRAQPRLTLKSFYLQEIEFLSRMAKIRVLKESGAAIGSLEHDGIKEMINSDSLDHKEMSRKLTDAVTEVINIYCPVELKEPDYIDVEGSVDDSHNVGLFVDFIPDEEHAEAQIKNSHFYYLRWMNRHFCQMSFMRSVVVQIMYIPGTDQISNFLYTNPRTLCDDKQGMQVITGITKSKENIKFITKPLVKFWLENIKRYTKYQIGFYPSKKEMLNYSKNWNSFGGLPYEGIQRREPEMEYVQPLLDHIKNILANGSQEHYNYQIMFYAACLQWKVKLGVLLIYYSLCGAGKDILIGDDGIMSFIYGKHHQKLANINYLLTNFNADAKDKLFVCLDEVTPYYKSHRNNDQLKDIITGKTTRIEQKNIDAYCIRDQRNFVAATNNPDGFKFERSERRQYMCEVSNIYTSEGPYSAEERLIYFANVLGCRLEPDEIPREATREEMNHVSINFYWYLMKVDLSEFNPRKFPSCELREQQMELHTDKVQEFFDFWQDNDINETSYDLFWVQEKKTASEVLQVYREFAKLQGYDEKEYTAIRLSHKLLKVEALRKCDENRKACGARFELAPSTTQAVR